MLDMPVAASWVLCRRCDLPQHPHAHHALLVCLAHPCPAEAARKLCPQFNFQSAKEYETQRHATIGGGGAALTWVLHPGAAPCLPAWLKLCGDWICGAPCVHPLQSRFPPAARRWMSCWVAASRPKR